MNEIHLEMTERLVVRNARLRAFVLRLLQPEEFGHSVTPEVRAAAREALNLPVADATVTEPST